MFFLSEFHLPIEYYLPRLLSNKVLKSLDHKIPLRGKYKVAYLLFRLHLTPVRTVRPTCVLNIQKREEKLIEFLGKIITCKLLILFNEMVFLYLTDNLQAYLQD